MTRAVICLTKLALLVGVFALAGCDAKKSSNPLGPSVAGPIGGVALGAPPPLSPAHGTEVVNTEPLSLMIGRAESNSARPFWYVVELAADAAFSSKLYTNGRVIPAQEGPTSLVVDVSLQPQVTYYWRVRAEDGANSSAFSPTAHFDLVVPVVVEPPSPRRPAGGETTGSRRPDLVVDNGHVAGRTGPVEYIFVVALDQAFTQIVAHHATLRSEGATTSLRPDGDLPPSMLFFWRAYAFDGSVMSGPSVTQAFRTPAEATAPGTGTPGSPVPPPPPGGRTADPPPGGKLPLPNMFGVVQQVAAQYPDALRRSCQHAGGTWEFMDRVVNALRTHDTRWGYNWKRGQVGNPSLDAVAYHWGSGADEGSTSVYIIDVIVGHCGPDPSAGWGDVTDITLESGTIGRWTGRGRF